MSPRHHQQGESAHHRARRAHHAAKGDVQRRKCKDCHKYKCDAELPADKTTREVALTIFAEAAPTSGADEFEAIASVMHNRVGQPGFGNPPDLHAVLTQTYYDRTKKRATYQFQGYQNARYKAAERGDLGPGDCDALKKAIAA